MPQTVEFEYAIGQTVEIVPLRYTDGGVSKVLGAVDSTINKATGHIYLVEYRHRDGATYRQTFRADQLAEVPPNEILGSAPTEAVPTPTFPRVIWQGTLEDDACYRIVHFRPKELVVEKRYRDALGDTKWNNIPWGDHSWSRSIMQALLAHETKPNGSDQDT